MESYLKTRLNGQRTDNLSNMLRFGLVQFDPAITLKPETVREIQQDHLDLSRANDDALAFRTYVLKTIERHQELDFGYMSFSPELLTQLLYGVSTDEWEHVRFVHVNLCRNLEYVIDLKKNLNELYEREHFDAPSLVTQLKQMRALWIALERSDFQCILDLMHDDRNLEQLILLTMLLHRAYGRSRRIRRCHYALMRIVANMPLNLIQYFNLDLIENCDLLVPFRRSLLCYLLQKQILLVDYPLKISPFYKPINNKIYKKVCDEVVPCNLESLFNEAQEQVSQVASQSRSDLEEIVHLWDKLPSNLSIEQMVNLARSNSAQEQALFTVGLEITPESQNFITQNLNKLGMGMTQLYTHTISSLHSLMESGFLGMQKLICYLLGAILVGVATYYKIKLISKLFSFFISFLFGLGSDYCNFAKEQSFDEESSWNGPLLLFLSVFGVSAGALSSSKCMNLIRLVSVLPRAEQGLESLFKWVKQTYDTCYRIFSRYFLGVEPGISVFADNHPVAKWLDELKEPYERFSKGIFSYDAASFSIIHSLFIRGLELQRSTSFRSDFGAIRTGMDCLNRVLSEFRVRNVVAGSVRNPPVVIHLYGDTGAGKSTLTNILAASIINRIQPGVDLKKQWKNLIYARAQEQEFWDGYTGQLVTVFDDFSQSADTAAKPNLEFFDIIRAANVYPYPLHMANLGEKGCTNFTSKLIVCSSNLKKPKTESLNFPSALYRRFDVCIQVRRAKKYVDVELDHYCHDFYEFAQYDMLTGKDLGGISWDQLVEKCVGIYHKRSEFVDSLDKMIDSVLSAPLFTKTEEMEKRVEGYLPVCTEEPEIAQEQVNCERLGYCDCEAWGEEECLFLPAKRTWYEKLYYKARRYISPTMHTVSEAFEQLRELSQEYLEKNRPRYNLWIKDLKKRFPFLENGKLVALVVGLIVTGPLVFFGVSKLLKPKDDVIVIRPMSEESYNSPAAQPVRMEAYTASNQTPVKMEGYSSPNEKPTQIEMNFPNGLVSGREMNLASQQLDRCVEGIVEQGVCDRNAAEVCSKVLTRNLFKIFIQSDVTSENIPLGHVVFLKGRIGLMPHHFAHAIKMVLKRDGAATIYFKSLFLQKAFTVCAGDFLQTIKPYESPEILAGTMLETRDLCSFHVSNAWNFPDITNLFVRKGDTSYMSSTKILLPTLSTPFSSTPFASVKVGKASSGVQREDCKVHGKDINDRLRMIRYCWKYSLETENGDCGAPLIARNPLLPGRKIMGIHVAGNPNFGFSTPVYKEDVDLIISSYAKEFSVGIEQCQPIYMPPGCHIPQSSTFMVLDKLSQPLFASSTTVIGPSVLNGVLGEVKTKPCQLRDTKEFSPMQYRLQKFATEELPIPLNLILNAEKAVSSFVINSIMEKQDLITTADKSVYTFEEAVSGISEEEFVNSIKRKSSPGYPFVLDSQWNAKEKIFGPGPEFCMQSEQAQLLKSHVIEIIEQAKLGVRQQHVFVDTLKDERKPIHKAHKTRMFSACPLDYLIACKMYFGGVVSVIQKARNDCGISVGTNVYSYDWTIIANTLLQKSNKMIAGDFEGFDSSQLQSVLRAAGNVLKRIAKEVLNASEEDLLVMQVLLESLLSSIHLNKDILYLWLKGLPSGHFLTAVINSLFVLLSFSMTWQLAFGVDLRRAFEFFEVCGIVAYGDDHVVSVPEWATQRFNQFTLIELMKKIGLSYTLEDKDAVVERPHRELCEVSFLKRRFLWDKDLKRFLAPLDINSIVETPMWVKKCTDPESQTLVELENSLRELSLHTQEVWDSHIESFKHGARLLGSFSRFLDREFAKDFVLNGNM